MDKRIVLLAFLLLVGTVSAQAQNRNQLQDTSGQSTTALDSVNGIDMSSMYKALIQVTIESKLDYYESSDALQRTAALTKRYYDALVDEGFTKEQALKIVIEIPLITNTEISDK